MLSRVAERVYWMARYLERVENTARLLNVYSTLLFDMPRRTRLGWGSLIAITGTEGLFLEKETEIKESSVIRFLLSEQNGISILSMLSALRENARTTREIIPSEAFEQINELYLFAKDGVVQGTARGARHELLQTIIERCQQITGLFAGTMSHNAAYSFIRIGRNLERADMTTRIVDVGSRDLLDSIGGSSASNGTAVETYDNILWMSVLRSLSAYQMYRQQVQHRVAGEEVVRYLIKDSHFPRAVVHCLEQVKGCIEELPNNEATTRTVLTALRHVKEASIDKLLGSGLFHFIDELQLEIGNVHEQIETTWFPKPD